MRIHTFNFKNAYTSNIVVIVVMPIFWRFQSSRKNRNESATVNNISENYEDVMESILGKTSVGNLNYAPMNTNVQNFVNINTEIETDIDINVSFLKIFYS